MLTNLDTYLAIAEEALNEAERLDHAARSPRPDGLPGFIIQYDPERISFKKSLITIAFSGMYFEALLFVLASKRFGRAEALKIDGKVYEKRLPHFGITDPEILKRCQSFREARNDLLHEKAVEITELEGVPIRTAQKVAKESVELVKHITNLLRPVP